MLAIKIGGREIRTYWLPDAAFDMNGDGGVSAKDHRAWVRDVKRTWYGDADLDGEFDSRTSWKSSWWQVRELPQPSQLVGPKATGTATGIFDSNDFVIAFQDGGYEQGPRTDVAAVPEPAAAVLAFIAACLLPFTRSLQLSTVVTTANADTRHSFCTAHADIYRWDNGQLIPGTEGITPGSGVQLDHMELEYAGLGRIPTKQWISPGRISRRRTSPTPSWVFPRSQTRI